MTVEKIFIASPVTQVPRPFIAVHGSDLSEIVQSIRKEVEHQSSLGFKANAQRLTNIADSFAAALRKSGVWSSPVSALEENPVPT